LLPLCGLGLPKSLGDFSIQAVHVSLMLPMPSRQSLVGECSAGFL
jgi:hypothetical protein